VAEDERGVCGTVQLVLDLPENQPHRADLAKMLVHRRARRRGLGAALLRAAEANFHRARAAVDGYLTTVSESQLLKVPGLQPLRGELLESARRFYQDFLKERGDDPTPRAELAATQARIGRIQSELGAADEARRALKSAIATYQAEVARDPQDPALRTALADTWLALGDLAYNFGGQDQGREMLAAWEHNAELREGLARGRPDDLGCQRELAESYDRLGYARDRAGRDGMPVRLRGAELRLALFLRFPDDPKLNFGLGESMNNIADALTNAGRHEDALALHPRGLEYTRFAYDQRPHMIDYGCDLGTSYMNAVRAYRNLGRTEEAVAEVRKAVAHCRRPVRDHPAAPFGAAGPFEPIGLIAEASRLMMMMKPLMVAQGGSPLDAGRCMVRPSRSRDQPGVGAGDRGAAPLRSRDHGTGPGT
jgi:tetratricopeptide (TPR) repeat protein